MRNEEKIEETTNSKLQTLNSAPSCHSEEAPQQVRDKLRDRLFKFRFIGKNLSFNLRPSTLDIVFSVHQSISPSVIANPECFRRGVAISIEGLPEHQSPSHQSNTKDQSRRGSACRTLTVIFSRAEGEAQSKVPWQIRDKLRERVGILFPCCHSEPSTIIDSK